jgi:DNA-binding NtrC family response regulator
VASTDLSVLITGESGTGKEVFPQIIHQYSARKHGQYIAVNCGAIPEGTIDSELFGHEKGAFTGAHESRKGYFEVADGGTIFLDEVAELPLSTQVRLLRVLETGEFIRVGSSKVFKTDVRVVAATNVDLWQKVHEGKFREDLFYRLSTVPVKIPPLRDRGEDVLLLFRKFALDFSEKYRMPPIQLTEDAKSVLLSYRWPGNVRQLKNVTEQISIIEKNREIDAETLKKYLPDYMGIKLPAVIPQKEEGVSFASEREILYKILFDLKNDINDLKKIVFDMLRKESDFSRIENDHAQVINRLQNNGEEEPKPAATVPAPLPHDQGTPFIEDTQEVEEETLSLAEKEVELIRKALDKHNGRRKQAARELGISERTLYRKIKEYNIN